MHNFSIEAWLAIAKQSPSAFANKIGTTRQRVEYWLKPEARLNVMVEAEILDRGATWDAVRVFNAPEEETFWERT